MSADFAQLIDRERLREAIAAVERGMANQAETKAAIYLSRERVSDLLAAAEAHLATLPAPTVTKFYVHGYRSGSLPSDRESIHDTLNGAAATASMWVEQGIRRIDITPIQVPA